MEVIFGVVSRILLKRASRRNATFCSQMLRRDFGQRRLSHFGFLSGGLNTAPRCNQSPGTGMGQIAHQPRPKNGTATRIRIAHHATHTKTTLKLRLPTGVPMSPARMEKIYPTSITVNTASCGYRLLRVFLMKGLRVSSIFAIHQLRFTNTGTLSTAIKAKPMERKSQLFLPTVNLPIMNGCIAPQVTLHRKRKGPGLSATKVRAAV